MDELESTRRERDDYKARLKYIRDYVTRLIGTRLSDMQWSDLWRELREIEGILERPTPLPSDWKEGPPMSPGAYWLIWEDGEVGLDTGEPTPQGDWYGDVYRWPQSKILYHQPIQRPEPPPQIAKEKRR